MPRCTGKTGQARLSPSPMVPDDRKTFAAYRPAGRDVSGPVAPRELTPEPVVGGAGALALLPLPAVSSPVCPAQNIAPTTMNIRATVIPINFWSGSLL